MQAVSIIRRRLHACRTPIVLTDDQQRTLQQWARGRSLPARQVERARVVLLAAAGKQDLEIAAEIGISNQKAARWRKRFLKLGLAGLGEGCAPPWTHATITSAKVQEIVRQDHAGEARQRNPLEHAHHGGGSATQREERAPHLAQTWPETTPVTNLQSQQRSANSLRNWKPSSGFISTRRSMPSCSVPTRRARSKHWTARNPACQSRRAAAEP